MSLLLASTLIDEEVTIDAPLPQLFKTVLTNQVLVDCSQIGRPHMATKLAEEGPPVE